MAKGWGQTTAKCFSYIISKLHYTPEDRDWETGKLTPC